MHRPARVGWLSPAFFTVVVILGLASRVRVAPPPPELQWGLLRPLEIRADLARLQTPSTVRYGQMSTADRREAIDDVWGPGLSTAEKLRIFDTFWQYVDEHFAAFQGIDVNWTALRDTYRPQVAGGVSRGRFAAIVNHMSLALADSHTLPADLLVNSFTVPVPGVPLLTVGGWIADTSGTCSTALADGSALVYSAVSNHPLGLEPGDRVLGYNGRPWRLLYRQLIAEELPIWIQWWGSSPSSFDHSFVMAAPGNWYLFDTMDIAKKGGQVVHMPTSLMPGPVWHGFCSEQMDVAGVPKPLNEFTHPVSWGTVEGTTIGYIYVWSWAVNSDAEAAFEEAILDLTQNQHVDGLIIDIRFNLGGSLNAARRGLAALLAHPTATIGFDIRRDPGDHFRMKTLDQPSLYKLDFDPRSGTRIKTSYDGPIALLVGPGALSAGDFSAFWTTEYNPVRVFGKPTSAAFNLPTQPGLGSGTEIPLHPSWFARVAEANAYAVGSPNTYLSHQEFPINEPVWLTSADVAVGRDTVVEAALRWLHNH
jgi:Periplasmic protease